MLTEAERSLIQRVWAHGPAVLLEEAGMSTEGMRAFLTRPEVQAEFAILDGEFSHATDLAERTKFLSRRNLSRLSGGAAATLAKAMRGPVYLRHQETGAIQKDAHGRPILLEDRVTSTQIRAAETVLDALGVTDRKGDGTYRGDFNLKVLVEQAETTTKIAPDPNAVTPKQRAISRERMRTAMLRLETRLPALRERLREAALLPSGPGPSGPNGSNGLVRNRRKAKAKKDAAQG